MAAKVVGIVGSYRKNRVIDTAVSEVLRGAADAGAEVAKIYLTDKHIEFCANCRTCTQEEDIGRRGKCIHDDDMEQVLQDIESAEGVVLGSPVNFFRVTAITKRFIERLLPYAYWPWGAKTGPRLRTKKRDKKAIVIASTAAPAFLSRLFIRAPLRELKTAAACVGAKPIKSLYFGLVAQSPDATLDQKGLRKCYAAGQKLVARLT
jgi:putative NADPH-quinone reductase